MYTVEHVLPMQNALGEGPLWHVETQTLYWIDHLKSQFFTYTLLSGQLTPYDLPYKPGCLAFLEGGGLLVAATNGLNVWRDNTLTPITGNIAHQPPNRFNDGAADRAGRFWVGTASDEPVNHLYCVDTDGTVQIVEHNIGISNGIAWSPDNKTLYYSDSGGAGIVWAYDFDLERGTITHRRTFLPPTGSGAVADGLTVDSEGCLWIAYWDGWKVCRYDPDAKLMAEIPVPVQRPTSCTFGGEALTTLYITSAGADLDRAQQPQTGDLFSIETGVKGMPEPKVRVTLA